MSTRAAREAFFLRNRPVPPRGYRTD